MGLFKDSNIVPSVMFHSVGLENHPWVWNMISEPVALFEEKCRALQTHRFNSIFWSELYAYMDGSARIPANSIFLTFDDGYLDNWVYVFPLLKKYGLKGTIFVNPDFVDPSTELRPNLEDVWSGKCRQEDLQVAGFLNWSEMKAMEAAGVIDIQSHSMSHTWYFVGPKIVDIHVKKDIPSHPWLFWNEKPERKPYYLSEDQQHFLPFGSPIFEYEKALVATRFFPDSQAVAQTCQFVQSQGVEGFAKRKEWQEELKGFIKTITNGDGVFPGYYESQDQRLARIGQELADSKSIIEKELNKQVDFICWPGGGNDKDVHALAKSIGYKSWTLASRDSSNFRNKFDSNPGYIKRIGSSNTVRIKGHKIANGGALFMLLKLWAHQDSKFFDLATKAYQIARIIK
jgi:peptidoglycan/xylan/chitin deacetylase (PgdA/CDA1 family)